MLDEVHRLRMDCDAILVGAETVERDNPSLTVRRIETERQPLAFSTHKNGPIQMLPCIPTVKQSNRRDYNRLLPLLND